MKSVLFFLSFLSCFSQFGYAQMTLEVTAMHQLTPLLDDIYVAGSFNNWDPADPNSKLTYNGTSWTIDISGENNSTIEFKFTRGVDWSTVEGGANGSYIPNRTVQFQNGNTQQFQISGWGDLDGIHSVTSQVRILDMDFEMPQLQRTRRIWICFPQDYFTSSTYYPVCYMHDGQNVFDAATSFAGEWQADETMQAKNVPNCASTIIVAIDNGGASRIDEYAPFLNAEYNEGGQGDEYAAFIVETLKPYIDQNFRTLADRANTSTAGSSLGALISMYMMVEYNNVFSKAGIFSPAFWFNPEIYDLATAGSMATDTQIHFVCGDSESAGMVGDMQEMVDIAANQNLNYTSAVVSGGQHNEYYWSLQFPAFVDDVLSCITAVEQPAIDILFQHVYPNPVRDTLQINFNGTSNLGIIIFDATGKTVINKYIDKPGNIDVSQLPAGLYYLRTTYFPNPATWNLSSDTVKFIKE